MILIFERSRSEGSALSRFLDLTIIPQARRAALRDANTPYPATSLRKGPDKNSPKRSEPQKETTTGLSSTERVTISAMTPPYMTWTRSA